MSLKRLTFSFVILFIVFSVHGKSVFASNPAWEEPYWQLPNCEVHPEVYSDMRFWAVKPRPAPVYNYVKKVIVIVEVQGVTGTTAEPLRKDNIEKMLVELYVDRYEKKEMCESCDVASCYARLNQAVEVLAFNTAEEKSIAEKVSLNPDVLTVYANIIILNKEKASVEIVNYRPHIRQPWWRELLGYPILPWEVDGENWHFSAVYDFDLEEENKILTKNLRSYFLGRIY